VRTTSLRCFVAGVLLALAGCDLALTAKPTGGHTGPAPLPEHRGLAARYPADKGISADPAVVVADDFEASPPGALPDRAIGERAEPPDSPWDRVWGRPTVTEHREHVHAGIRTLELARNGPGAVGVRKALDPGFDRLFLRYYIKYDDAFPGAHHVGGALQARAPGVPEANPGVKPDGANQYDVLLDHWPFDRRVSPPGHLVAYVYHMDQRHKWGEQFYPSGRTQPATNGASGFFGRSFVTRKDFVPARGRWQCHELMVQANTPGQRDGRVAFWVDGRLAADFPNIRFRTVDALKINRVGVGMYESRKNRRQRVWIDDIVVATSYIGPMATAR
jgi:hypothetical protein